MTIKQIASIALALLFTFNGGLVYANEQGQATSINEDGFYNEDRLNIALTVSQPEFTIKLKSNPTTGYRWYLREYNSELIVPVKHEFLKPEQKKLMGAPAYELWTFKMKPAGFVVPQQTTLRMVYARGWQGADNSTQLVFRVSTQENKD